MNKRRFLKKRMLALALSVFMAFASADTYVVLAEESANPGEAIIEVSDTATDEIDIMSQPNEADETTASNDSDTAVENDTVNDSDTMDGSDPARDPAQEEDGNEVNGDNEESSESELLPESQSEVEAEAGLNETIPEAGVASDAENADALVDSGMTNNISWSIDSSGCLTITGSGDYEVDDNGNPPWWEYRKDVITAMVNVSGITSTSGMFYNCSNMISADLSYLDTGNVMDMSFMFCGCSSLTDLDLRELKTSNVENMSMMFASCNRLRSLDLSNFNTENVTDMSGMFYQCVNLNVLNLSNFDTRNVTNMLGMFPQFAFLTNLDLSSFDMKNVTTEYKFSLYGSNKLTRISVPKNIPEDITINLPTGNRTDKWYDEDANTYTKLPSGLTDSITLYKNAFIDDEGTIKTVLNISGITIDSKTYDGMPNEFTGTPVAKDMMGNVITDVIIDYYYEGILTNGSGTGMTTEAPTQAGQYSLVFLIEEHCEYIAAEKTYSFNINQKKVTITAPTVSIEAGEELPELSELTSEVDGFLENDTFITEPQLKYGAENISTSVNGTYEIIPYGAEAGNNYSINYVNGILFVEEIVTRGTTNNILWKISKNGKLTITGTGDYEVDADGKPPWAGREDVRSILVNVSDITSTSNMFRGVGQYVTSIDLSNLDTSKVTDMSYMFYGFSIFGTNIDSLDLRSLDTSNVTDMSYMFYDFSSRETSIDCLDLRGFDTSNVTDMSYMFALSYYLDGGFSAVDLSSFDTGNVTDMSHMFEHIGVDELNLSGFNTNNVTNMSYMFNECNNLTDLNISSFNTSNVTNMNHMFGNSGLTSLDLSGFDFSNVTNMYRIFATEHWLTKEIVSNETMKSIDLGDFNISKMTDVTHMFEGLVSLTSIEINSSDTSKVTNMESMFEGCSSLTSLDLSSFDTRKVTKMNRMFYGCRGLTSLDLNSFDTGEVFKMNHMFDNCSALVALDLSSFDLSKVISMDDLFYNCKDLSLICTPKNCKVSVKLPTGNSRDKWYDENKKTYTTLPKNRSGSIALYKNSYPGDGATEPVLFITGISMEDKVYDKTANPFTGTPVARDSSGNSVSDVSISYTYSGKLIDGSTYTKTTEAPTQAGNYKLSFEIDGRDVYLTQSTYSFRIIPREVTITAKSVYIIKNEQVPAISELTYAVEGLLDGDTLLTDPQLKYSAENISASKSGRYDIIPYGAETESNYSIKYVYGKLAIVPPDDDPEWGEVLTGDRPEDGYIPNGFWIAGVEEKGYAYTGSAIKPEIRVYDHTTLLQLKTDYTISYKNNTKVNDASVASKAPTITVIGKGNYSGKDTETFKILALDISEESGDNMFEADDISVAYSGKAQKPVPVLVWNGKKLKNKTDYTFTYHGGTYETTGADGGNADRDTADTGTLDSVKEAANYYIKITGKGNFTGTRRIKLTVLPADAISLKPISNAMVTKIPNQSYQTQYQNGRVTPEVTVKYGSETLTEGTHYTVSYSNNTKVGTAYAVIKGIEENGYSGTKRVSFKITGMAVEKATVTGLSGKEFIYSGVDIEPDLKLTIEINGQEKTLVPKTDYEVTWQNNRNAGKATAVITGLGGYTGTVKKTFKIKAFDVTANEGGRFAAELEEKSVPYAKGGAKPALKVTFINENKEVQTLTEGKDYTLTYKNNTAVYDRSDADQEPPTVTIKGKGSFSGIYDEKPTYTVTAQDIGNLSLSAADRTFQNKKNKYAASVAITDINGKELKAGTDYDKTYTYKYISEATLGDGTHRVPGDAVDKDDIVPAGTVLEVTVSSKGNNYTGSIKGEYRITKASISGASVSIPKQTYTGQAITLGEDQITVKVKGKKLDTDQYEIVPGSYKNNTKKGTASVTIRGINNYGGTKTVKFSIRAKGFLWWWRN